MRRLATAAMFVAVIGCMTGCATVQTALHLTGGAFSAANLQTYLTDAQDGVNAAYTVQWLSQSEYATITAVIATAQAATNGSGSVATVQADVKTVLTDFEATLPASSKLPAYINWLIAIL